MKYTAVLALCGIILSLTPRATLAQDCTEWSLRAVGGPSSRAEHAITFDPLRQRTIIFGGHTKDFGLNAELLGDTWVWNGDSWNIAATTGPSARFGASMVFDTNHNRVVLFGGARFASNGSLTLLGDTWEWDGRIWTKVSPPTSPPARYLHAMAYDTQRGRVVLFGGVSAGSARDQETWEYNGSTWTRVTQSGPSYRYGHTMAFDPIRNRTVLFGGIGRHDRSGGYLGDTWEWNGTQWNLIPVSGPAPRVHHSMVFSTKVNRVVLLGGRTRVGEGEDIWEWTGSQWVLVSQIIGIARQASPAAFDTLRQRIVLFAGYLQDYGQLQDTWEQTSVFAPSISRQPQPVEPVNAQPVTLSVEVTTSAQVAFQWRRDGSFLVDGPNIIGTGSPALTILSYSDQFAGTYDVVVANQCGQADSAAVTLDAGSSNGCAADVDNGSGSGIPDEAVTIDDLIYYIQAFQNGQLNTDVDDGTNTGHRDGGITIDDLLYFLARFSLGC